MGKRIVAIDDETDVLMILKTALQSEGFEVETANNGPDGLALAHAGVPDLILLDNMMPGMTGFDVLKALKDDDVTCRIPVIMLTGMSERKNIQHALNSGIDFYIVKPFEFQDLLNKVNQALASA
jgi:DNA-binding response OmpR family regulator